MKLSIAFVTGRNQPCLEWMLDSLATQAHRDDEIEIIVVDVLGRDLMALASPAHFTHPWLRHAIAVRPKPCHWQGASRLTSCDWWALSNARNTALCLARSSLAVTGDNDPYVAFLDDRCHLGPDWLATVRAGERARASVIGGSYKKDENGQTTWDHRIKVKPAGMINCGGGWLYGCTLALPLSWALEVNGFEEGCDGLGMEDVIFGLNLHNAGRRIDFVPSMFVHQERSIAGFGPVYRKTDKGISPRDKSHAALARFGKRRRTEMTPDLTQIRAELAAGGNFPASSLSQSDWYDDQPIAQMV